MIFDRLTGGDCLRDLMISIVPHKTKYYHLGFETGTSKSNFANANEKLYCRIFEEDAFYLVDRARKSSIVDQDFQLNIDGNIYAFDSTTIDLCLSVFWWTMFLTTKGGIKPHTRYDVNALGLLYYEPGGYYILDRGYVDYERFFRIHQNSAFFVVKSKR